MSASAEIETETRFDRVVCYQRRFAGEALDTLLNDPDAVFGDAEPEQRLKHDRTTTLVNLINEDRHWVGKRYNTKGPWHAVRRCFKPTRARNCWDMAHRLLAAGICVAQPVAMLEQRLGPLRRRSYYFCEYIAGTPLEKMLGPDASPQTIEQMCDKFRELFTKLAQARIAHGDMKITNLLVAGHDIVLLDLDVVSVYPAARYARAYRKDRARFLRNWDHLPELRQKFSQCVPEHPSQ